MIVLPEYKYITVLLSVCLSVEFARGAPPRFELRTRYVNGTHASRIFRSVQRVIAEVWLALKSFGSSHPYQYLD